jgi:zinc transport system ATP-binding protein
MINGIQNIDKKVNSSDLMHDDHSCGGCCTRLEDFGVTIARRVILEHINLHIHCGELTVIVGPNGAGKTTLFRAMLGEIPHSGRLSFSHAHADQPRHPALGYVPQKLEFDPGSPVIVLDLFTAILSRKALWLGYDRKVRDQAARALTMVNAQHLLHQYAGQLSGGELQRVLLALALTPIPDILLLDEPVSGVDPAGIDLFYSMVSDLREMHDLSILLVSHDLPSAARYADRMIFLNKSILADGTPGEVLRHEKVIQTFGNGFEIHGLPAPVRKHSHKARSCKG